MSKKVYIYITLILILLGVLYYYFDLGGIFSGIFGLVGLSGAKFNRQQSKLKKLEIMIDDEVKKIEQEQDKLKNGGVENKTAEEEVDYWKNH